MKALPPLALGLLFSAGVTYAISRDGNAGLLAAVEFLFIAAAAIVSTKLIKLHLSPLVVSIAAMAIVIGVTIFTDGAGS